MLSIPIKGESKSPIVNIFPETELNFEDVYLNYTYEKLITLFNDSNLKAKFFIKQQ